MFSSNDAGMASLEIIFFEQLVLSLNRFQAKPLSYKLTNYIYSNMNDSTTSSDFYTICEIYYRQFVNLLTKR